MSILLYFSLAAAIACVVMAIAFAVALRLNFFSLVDVVWAFSFGLIAICFGIVTNSFDERWVFIGMMLLWSIRLGAYLLARLHAHFPNEDSRYIELREKWSEEIVPRFAKFFWAQALSVVILCTPLILITANPVTSIGPLAKAAILLWLIGVIGEAIADAQLRAFKMDPKNHGQVCEVGLWRMCRHPNYFFEWIIWCSFGIYGLAAPLGILSLIAPIMMFYLLYFVSGVPPAEAHSIKSKGQLYLDYQRHTNKFFPGMPKQRS